MRILNTRRPGTRSGFSLVELTVAVALLAIVLTAVLILGSTTSSAVTTGTVSSDVDTVLGRTLERVSRELVVTGLGVLQPDPLPPFGSEVLDYQKPVGVSSGVALWSNRHRIGFEYENGEIDDGLDNNHNGLADEGVVFWTQDVNLPTERRVVFCHSVREYLEGEQANGLDDNGNGLTDERGFCVVRQGETLIVRVTIERRGAKGRRFTQTLTTSVKPRNSQGAAP